MGNLGRYNINIKELPLSCRDSFALEKIVRYSFPFHEPATRRLLGFLVGLASLIASQHRAAADDKIHETTVRPFLAKHCLECHGPKAEENACVSIFCRRNSPRRNKRLAGKKCLKNCSDGEMPPEDKPRPPQADSKQWSIGFKAHCSTADRDAQKKQGRVVLRRLNRIEYQNTVRDLLAIDVELIDLLPEDETADGFDNIAEALHISPGLMERYLQTAEIALDAAIVHEPNRPLLLQKRYSYKDRRRQIQQCCEKDDGVVFFFDYRQSHGSQGIHRSQ